MNIKYIEKNTDMKVEYYETIGSTNERAKEIAEEMIRKCLTFEKTKINLKKINQNLENIQVVISESQTHGKGTNGRVWYSTSGENVLMTLLFYPQKNINEFQGITYSIAEMIQGAINDLYDIELKIKLPNDLLLNGKKICGILTESSTQNEEVHYILIGIGFNVNQVDFSDELKEIATSLKKEYPEINTVREEIIVKIVNCIKSLF